MKVKNDRKLNQNRSHSQNQSLEFFPFGETLVEEHLNSYNSPFKFNAKELDAETGNYYYGARYYDPKWSIWLSVDPLFSKYPTLSPYIYTANNPIVFIDPDGMQIEPGSQTEWDKQKQNVAIEHAAAGVMFAFTGRQGERYGSLSETMDVLNCLENSSQVYSLNSGALDSEVTYDPNTGNIVISYNGTSLFVHETTHAGQFETGDIAFSSSGAVLAQDVYDEVAAYKAQYAYNPASVSSLPSSSEVNSMSDITPAWVQGIKAPNGDQPYKLGGTTNTGVSPVNVNSTRDQLIKAYPHLKSGLQALPANATLKSEIPTMYYKN